MFGLSLIALFYRPVLLVALGSLGCRRSYVFICHDDPFVTYFRGYLFERALS